VPQVNQAAKKLLTNMTFFILLTLPLFGFAQSISEFTQDMKKDPGFYTFYYDQTKGKVYVELTEFNQPFIFQSSLPMGIGSNDLGLDRGQLGATRMVQFEKYGDKVLLKQLNTYFKANTSNAAERQSIREAFASSVIAGFTIAASNDDKVLIDYSDFLLSDIHGIGRKLTQKKQGNYSVDDKRSAIYVERSKSFLKNTEFEALITFNGTKPGNFVKQVAADPYSLTVHMHHSFIQLPDDNYKPRTFSPYSGYTPQEVKDYASAIDEPMQKRYISRHRLVKKDANAKLSQAVEPIIYYLDPGVPEPVRGALMDGASWWNEAFEAIGYKNGFQVKILPEDADPMDIRYNVIQWVHRATRGWSYGSSVIDPRTGEIIKGHVTLGSLRVRQDLLIAQGLTAAFDGQPKKLAEAKAMALDRIRQLSAHEVGHTLGFAHNFAASANDRASVMDYPHPLITLDNNGDVVLTGAYDKGIGAWDKFVVAYGYTELTGDETPQLTQLEQQAKAKGLLFIASEARRDGASHPKAHLWDNGADPVKELNRMVKVRQKALSKFGLNTLGKGQSLSQLEENLVPIYLFHRYQTEAAVKLISGLDYSYEVNDGSKVKGSQIVKPQRQKAALQSILATIDAQFLTLPESTLKLLLPKAWGEYRDRESFKTRTGLTFDAVSIAEVAARHSISLLLNPKRLNRLQQQSARVTGGLTVEQLVEDIFKHSIKASQQNGLNGMVQKRVSNVAVELVMQALLSDKVAPEVKAVLYDQIVSLVPWLTKSKAGHLRLLKQQIIWFEKTGKWQSQFKLLSLPPGSPI
jgi:hypothetical protein